MRPKNAALYAFDLVKSRLTPNALPARCFDGPELRPAGTAGSQLPCQQAQVPYIRLLADLLRLFTPHLQIAPLPGQVKRLLQDVE